jgi:hypothetical protein
MTLAERYARVIGVVGPKIEFVDARGCSSLQDVEPFSVVKTLENHRNFWKPTEVKTLLIAESHVYTTPEENARGVQTDRFDLPGCPSAFVRLVYCLGYGEDGLVSGEINNNSFGTPQFWKIFFASCNAVTENSDCDPILKRTRDLDKRIKNKIQVLRALKDQGTWLIDASMLALYHNRAKPAEETRQKLVLTTWEVHLKETVCKARPNRVIFIGKEVAGYLQDQVAAVVGYKPVPLPLPSARLKGGYLPVLKQFFELT